MLIKISIKNYCYNILCIASSVDVFSLGAILLWFINFVIFINKLKNPFV